jgi:hypothetical protein
MRGHAYAKSDSANCNKRNSLVVSGQNISYIQPRFSCEVIPHMQSQTLRIATSRTPPCEWTERLHICQETTCKVILHMQSHRVRIATKEIHTFEWTETSYSNTTFHARSSRICKVTVYKMQQKSWKLSFFVLVKCPGGLPTLMQSHPAYARLHLRLATEDTYSKFSLLAYGKACLILMRSHYAYARLHLRIATKSKTCFSYKSNKENL